MNDKQRKRREKVATKRKAQLRRERSSPDIPEYSCSGCPNCARALVVLRRLEAEGIVSAIRRAGDDCGWDWTTRPGHRWRVRVALAASGFYDAR